MGFFRELIKKDIVKKIFVLAVIILILFLLRDMLNLFLLTFLFTYLIYSAQKAITSVIGKFVHINEKIITVLLYVLLVSFIVFVISKYIPIMFFQTRGIVRSLYVDLPDNWIVSKYVIPAINGLDFSYISKSSGQIVKYAAGFGKFSLDVVLAFILSLFFLLEKKKVMDFVSRFKNSSLAFFYDYTKDFCNNFVNSFGKVIQAQLIIALVNSVLSVICLSILGFTQIMGLGLMIFLFSLIPVAGTIISLIPLSVIAFKVGGIKEILYVLILIACLHTLESYVLNPKLMSDKTELPVFFIFLVLLISEHFIGVWGLLIGVPLFMFILDLLNVKAGTQKKQS